MKKRTQNQKVFELLRRSKDGITHADVEDLIGCTRLAARINDLKELGVIIDRMMVKVRTRDGGTARVARYRLVGVVGNMDALEEARCG